MRIREMGVRTRTGTHTHVRRSCFALHLRTTSTHTPLRGYSLPPTSPHPAHDSPRR